MRYTTQQRDWITPQILHSGKSVLSQGFRGAHNKRHYYEDIALPENLIIVGDAVAHFNPCVHKSAHIHSLSRFLGSISYALPHILRMETQWCARALHWLSASDDVDHWDDSIVICPTNSVHAVHCSICVTSVIVFFFYKIRKRPELTCEGTHIYRFQPFDSLGTKSADIIFIEICGMFIKQQRMRIQILTATMADNKYRRSESLKIILVKII